MASRLYNSSFGNMLLKPKERGEEPRAVIAAAEATPWDGSHKNKSRTHSLNSSGSDEKRRRLSLSTSWGDAPAAGSTNIISKGKAKAPASESASRKGKQGKRYSLNAESNCRNAALLAKVRVELKTWETEFQASHNRRAKQADIAAVEGLCKSSISPYYFNKGLARNPIFSFFLFLCIMMTGGCFCLRLLYVTQICRPNFHRGSHNAWK